MIMIEINIIPEKENNFAECEEFYKGKKETKSYDIFEQIDNKKFFSKNIKFKSKFNGIVYLDYPLKVTAKIIIYDIKDIYDIIKGIREAYKQIYKNPLLYKIWGHWIGDLCIEEITLMEDNLIHVFIGS